MNKTQFKVMLLEHHETQEQLAKGLGITRATLSYKVTGQSEFTQGEIRKIKERYGLTPEQVELIFFTDDVSC